MKCGVKGFVMSAIYRGNDVDNPYIQ